MWPFYKMSQNESQDEPLYRFPHAFNDNAIIDEALKLIETFSYEDVARNFSEYVNGVSIVSCVFVYFNTFVLTLMFDMCCN